MSNERRGEFADLLKHNIVEMAEGRQMGDVSVRIVGQNRYISRGNNRPITRNCPLPDTQTRLNKRGSDLRTDSFADEVSLPLEMSEYEVETVISMYMPLMNLEEMQNYSRGSSTTIKLVSQQASRFSELPGEVDAKGLFGKNTTESSVTLQKNYLGGGEVVNKKMLLSWNSPGNPSHFLKKKDMGGDSKRISESGPIHRIDEVEMGEGVEYWDNKKVFEKYASPEGMKPSQSQPGRLVGGQQNVQMAEESRQIKRKKTRKSHQISETSTFGRKRGKKTPKGSVKKKQKKVKIEEKINSKTLLKKVLRTDTQWKSFIEANYADLQKMVKKLKVGRKSSKGSIPLKSRSGVEPNGTRKKIVKKAKTARTSKKTSWSVKRKLTQKSETPKQLKMNLKGNRKKKKTFDLTVPVTQTFSKQKPVDESEIVSEKTIHLHKNLLTMRETEDERKEAEGAGDWEDVSQNVSGLLQERESELISETNRRILEKFDQLRDDKWALQNQLDYQRTKADAYKQKFQVLSNQQMAASQRSVVCQLEDSRSQLAHLQQELSSKRRVSEDFDVGDVLYSICSEFFVDRANFKHIMFSRHLSELDQYGSFAPGVYFTHEFEFGAH